MAMGVVGKEKKIDSWLYVHNVDYNHNHLLAFFFFFFVHEFNQKYYYEKKLCGLATWKIDINKEIEKYLTDFIK